MYYFSYFNMSMCKSRFNNNFIYYAENKKDKLQQQKHKKRNDQ